MTQSRDEPVFQARCLTYTAPGCAELRPVRAELVDDGRDELVAMRALWSAVSRGTERLVLNGDIPESEHQRMRAPFQRGEFPFPVGYGYAWVGRAENGGDEQAYFGLFPHQDHILAPRSALVALPAGLDPRRATLAANMETALNIAWDAAIGPADRIAIVGGGVLGLLVAGLAAAMPGSDVTVVDIEASRAAPAEAMGAHFAIPAEAEGEADIVIHTSASEAGLATALRLAGTESTIVEASWYGANAPRVPLGGAFHSKRLTLRSSQVGMVSPSRRPRWTYRRRLEAALNLLRDPRYDALITGEVAFDRLADEIPSILDPGSGGLATVVTYL